MKETSATTHSRRAVIELRERILRGDIPGGTRVYEVVLAEEMRISRTPMREAMSRLVEEGLLDRLPHGGFVVRRFGLAEVVDAIELRAVLEGTAARMAAERGVAPEALVALDTVVADLDSCFGAALDEVDFTRYADLNDHFHQMLWDLPGSSLISREMRRVVALPFASPSSFLPDRLQMVTFHRSLRLAQEQHRSLVDAIRHREGGRAEGLAREHGRMTRQNLEHVLAQSPELLKRIPALQIVEG